MKPVYCKDCNSMGSYARCPERDMVGVKSGQVLEEAWKCRLCGHVTFRIPDNLKGYIVVERENDS